MRLHRRPRPPRPPRTRGFARGDDQQPKELAARDRATLLLSALTIHNLPEGLAVGVAFAAGGSDLGLPLAIAIGIQNVPEGFAAARAAAAPRGHFPAGRRGVAALTGAVEPPAALAAYATFEVSGTVLAGALAFAAGAMLHLVVDELVPESHGYGHEQAASLALLGGFAPMMALDNAL